MKWSACLLVFAVFLTTGFQFANAAEKQAATVDQPLYEMRTYYPKPGKFEPMVERFRRDSCRLLEKHGMRNVAYFVQAEGENAKLVYFLAHQSQEAKDASWKAFLSDPEWKEVYRKSHENGPLVEKIDSLLLKPTSYSPLFLADSSEPMLYELRTYTAAEGRLEALNRRFSDHTLKLFGRHGIKNVVYFDVVPGQTDADSNNTLIYLIAHQNAESREASFVNFRQDPEWLKVRAASEEAAGGPLTVKDGVKSELFLTTDFSPLK